MTVDLATLLKVAPFPEEQTRLILDREHTLTDEQREKLIGTAWEALAQMYLAREEYEKEMLKLEIAQGKRQYRQQDFEGLEDRATENLAQHLRENSSASSEQIWRVIIELKARRPPRPKF